MRQSHLIISNAVIMWATKAFQIIQPLILVPYLIHRLGETGYGAYALIWSLIISIEQLQLSLQQGVVKYSAGFLAQGRINDVNSIVSSSFVYSILLAVLACSGMLIAAAFYKDPSGQISTAFAVVGIMVLCIFPLTPYIAVIQSRNCYYVGAIFETVAKYAGLLAVVAWFHFVGPSVVATIIIMAGAMFFASLSQVPVAYHMIPGLQNRLNLCNREHFRLIVSFGGMVVLISLCLMVNTSGIQWLMNSLESTSFVAHLVIIIIPSGLLAAIIGAMTITAMPATSAYHATGNQNMLQELLIRGMRYSMILVLASLLIAVLLMRNILSIWIGPYYEFLAPYSLVLFVSAAFVQSTAIAHHMLKGLGKLRVVGLIYFFSLVIVPITLILIIFMLWHNPYTAAIVGLAFGNVVCGCLNISFCTQVVHADVRIMLIRAYVQPLCVAAAVYLPVLSIATYSGLEGFVARALISIFAVLIFLGCCYAFIATVDERREIKTFFQMALDRVAEIRGM